MPPPSVRPPKAKGGKTGGIRRVIIVVVLGLVAATLAANLLLLNPSSNAVERVHQHTKNTEDSRTTRADEPQQSAGFPTGDPGATAAVSGVRRAGAACDVNIPELEPSWSRYFAEASWDAPSCGEPAHLARVEARPGGALDVVENPGECAGVLMLSFVDPASSNWTAVPVRGRAALPVDSAILQCLRHEDEAPRPDAPTQLILHPLVDRALLSRAQVLLSQIVLNGERNSQRRHTCVQLQSVYLTRQAVSQLAIASARLLTEVCAVL